MLKSLRKSSGRGRRGAGSTRRMVARARAPVFFTRTGRRRHRSTAASTWSRCMPGWCWSGCTRPGLNDAAQALTDALFIGFDEALREQGAGDMGMGRRDEGDGQRLLRPAAGLWRRRRTKARLAEALARNVYRGAAVHGAARGLSRAMSSRRARAPGARRSCRSGDVGFRAAADERHELRRSSQPLQSRPARPGRRQGRHRATADERARIAHWAGVDASDAFTAQIDLRKMSPTAFASMPMLDAPTSSRPAS